MRLPDWAQRPLTERERKRAFVIVVGLAVAVFIAFSVTGRPAKRALAVSPGRPSGPPTATATPARTATPTPPAAPLAPLKPGAPRCLKAFLKSYLAYTYGHANAARLRCLTAPLRTALASAPPRVPVSIKHRHYHWKPFDLGVAIGTATAVGHANVDDGVQRYVVTVTLSAGRQTWRVSAVD